MTEIKSNGVPQEIKCNELPQETTLTNTLKLIGNSDNQIRQIGVDLLRDYVNNTLQGQIDIIQDYIGNLNDLSTTQKDSLVNAVKEVDNKIDVLNTGISTVQSDITELNSALGTLGTSITEVRNAFGYGTFHNGFMQIGKLVCVSFGVGLATNIAAGKNLCSGLPQPLSDIAILNVYNGAMSSYSRAKITSDGVVYVESGHNSGASLLVNGSYIAK